MKLLQDNNPAFWHSLFVNEVAGIPCVVIQRGIDRFRPIDIAFQVCDPRLDSKGAGGIYLFAETFDPGILVPLHTFGEYEYNRKAEGELIRQGYRKTFWRIDRPGAVFAFGQDQ
jgi:hypothetical protein